ncbi:helix-turn-helix domain-containing protein [Anaerobutyricum hallii]
MPLGRSYLTHKQNITVSTIEKLCRILSCTPND